MATENQENKSDNKSRREMLNERMLSKYPDLDLNDDEAVSGRISDDFDEYDRRIGEFQANEDKLNGMMKADPRSAYLLASLDNGEDLIVSLVNLLGEDIRTILDDPESEASKALVKRAAEGKERIAQSEANVEETKKVIAAWQEENGLSNEEGNQVLDFLQGVLEDGLKGIVSRESLDMGLNAIRHDDDVATAAEDAEVKGRNAKIDETLRKRNEGDGVAALDGANNPPQQKRRPNIFDYAEAAK